MRSLIDNVERGPVSSNAHSRRRAVPKVCAALRRRDPFEDVGRRCSREVTAHDEAALAADVFEGVTRSEEHTSELQSHHDLVCRLLLEKKKKKKRENKEIH